MLIYMCTLTAIRRKKTNKDYLNDIYRYIYIISVIFSFRNTARLNQQRACRLYLFRGLGGNRGPHVSSQLYFCCPRRPSVSVVVFVPALFLQESLSPPIPMNSVILREHVTVFPASGWRPVGRGSGLLKESLSPPISQTACLISARGC